MKYILIYIFIYSFWPQLRRLISEYWTCQNLLQLVARWRGTGQPSRNHSHCFSEEETVCFLIILVDKKECAPCDLCDKRGATLATFFHIWTRTKFDGPLETLFHCFCFLFTMYEKVELAFQQPKGWQFKSRKNQVCRVLGQNTLPTLRRLNARGCSVAAVATHVAWRHQQECGVNEKWAQCKSTLSAKTHKINPIHYYWKRNENPTLDFKQTLNIIF